jgi:hypothetical protein
VLLGVDESRATIWMIHSESIAPGGTIKCEHMGSAGTSSPGYNYFEAIVSRLKSVFETGVKTIVIAGSKNVGTAEEFMTHVRKHHAYLLKEGQTRTIHPSVLDGEAGNVPAALKLVKSDKFKAITASTLDQETSSIIDILEAVINNPAGIVHVHFTIDEIDAIFQALRDEEGQIPEYVLMTEVFYAANKSDARLQRVFTFAKKLKVKTRVVQSKTGPGARIAQLGGLVCFTSPPD